MKQIYFKQPKLLEQVCSNSEPSYFAFKGENTRKSKIKVLEHKTSCGCTTAFIPDEISMGEFEVVLKVDKSGQQGNFAQSCHLTFSNGQTEVIYVAGTIEPFAESTE